VNPQLSAAKSFPPEHRRNPNKYLGVSSWSLGIVPTHIRKKIATMKSPRTSTVLALATCASYAAAILTFKIAKHPEAKSRRRHLSGRNTITSVLYNNVTGGSYYAEVNVGTPGQKQTLAIDTGSSDVWLLSSNADLCSDPTVSLFTGEGCGSTCKCCCSVVSYSY